MKADSGSWIYIVLSVLFLIISAIGKNKKKAETASGPVGEELDTSQPNPEKAWPRNFEEVLTDVFDLPKQKEVSYEKPPSRNIYSERYEKPVETIDEEEAQSLETTEIEKFSYETPVVPNEYVKPQYQSMVVKSEDKLPKTLETVFESGEFNLKKGIIYAEILNRKYF